ncbi:hypothetical protein Tco_1497665 [Tanacetum coccineum]
MCRYCLLLGPPSGLTLLLHLLVISKSFGWSAVANCRWRNPTMAIACNGDAVEFNVSLGSGVDRGYSGDGVGSGDG